MTKPVSPNQTSLFGAPFETSSRTSREAAVLIAPHSATLRARVLTIIRNCGDQGATDDEIEVVTGLRHQTASARRRELVLGNFIKDSGRTRPTRSNRQATVWVAL
jgi:hypothetical protein